MSIAKISNGTLLKHGDGGFPIQFFTTVPEVMRLSGPAIRFDLLDVSSHDTVGLFREYIPGMADGDRIRAEVNWRPSNTIHIAIRVDSYNATLRNFQIIFPDSLQNTVLVNTYVETMTPNADIARPLTSGIDLKITGAPIWS